MSEEKDYLGHRKRLKDRFLKAKQGDLPEYEILELALFYAIPRKDTKPLAKKLLASFGSLSGVINADEVILKKYFAVNDNVHVIFKLIRELISRMMRHNIIAKPIISSWQATLEYLKVSMGHAKVEMFRIIYLNKKNMIIEDELVHQGTIDEVAVYPREIAKKALFLNASAIILVHNHPSGKAYPSKNDIQLTEQIIKALKPLNIIVHDHIIVSNNDHYSFKVQGII